MSQSDTPNTQTTSRVAIVTGGSGGIGAASARRLAADGATVVVHYSGNEAKAREVVSSIVAAGGAASAVRADVADEAEVAAMFDEAEHHYGGVDVVVNTAGVMLLAPLVDADLADFDRQVRTNLRGTFVVSQAAGRRLRGGGALINFSSSVTRLSQPTYSAYAATKGATEAMTLIFARELKGRDITVNAIAPGPVATSLFLEGKSPEAIDAIAGMNPMNRLGEPEDIAATVSFLAGPDGRWTNGQILFDNGGAV